MEPVTNTGKTTQTLYKSRKQTHNRRGWERKWWNVSGRKALLLMWHPLCRCLLELNADMQWLAKVWQEEPCCLSPAPPAGEACACTPGRRAEELEETDEEGERGEIKLEQMGQQAISIFSISLWICKTDRSSRHQWLSSLWTFFFFSRMYRWVCKGGMWVLLSQCGV